MPSTDLALFRVLVPNTDHALFRVFVLGADHGAAMHVTMSARWSPILGIQKASPPSAPSPVPRTAPLGGVVPPPTPAEWPPCHFPTMWCPYSSTTCRNSLTQVVGASLDMVADQLQARMTCHGADAHAMTWVLACDLVLLQEVTVWASHATPPMTQ